MNQSGFVGRAGDKLQFALDHFNLSVRGKVCADFGSAVGGFVDCLLQNGAARVYAVDTGYGQLNYRLRQDWRVVVLERHNALHVNLPEKVDLLTVDTGWTRQQLIIPNALRNLKDTGQIVTLIKPHYEADPKLLHRGRLAPEDADAVARRVVGQLRDLNLTVSDPLPSPLPGGKAGNREYLVLISRPPLP